MGMYFWYLFHHKFLLPLSTRNYGVAKLKVAEKLVDCSKMVLECYFLPLLHLMTSFGQVLL